MHPLRTLSCASLLLLGACSSDTKETTDTSTADGSGSDTGNGSGGGSGSGDAGPTCQTTNEGSGGAVCSEDTALCGDIYTPTSYRVTYARILKPAGLGPILGTLINRDINANLLHIVVTTKGFSADRPNATFSIGGGGGCVLDTSCGTYTWDSRGWEPGATEPVQAQALTDGNGAFASTTTLSINFPALAPNNPPDPKDVIIFPIKELDITGTTAIDDQQRTTFSGTLKGAILKADCNVEIALTAGQPGVLLCQLLGGDRTLNYPAGPGEKTGWIFEAEYDTERVTLIPGETCPFLLEGSGDGSGSGN
jgi:hypothetical protein